MTTSALHALHVVLIRDEDSAPGLHKLTLVSTKRSHVSETTRTEAVRLMSRSNASSPK